MRFCLLIFTNDIAMPIISLIEIFFFFFNFYREFEDSLSGNLPLSCEGTDIPLHILPCALSPSEMMTLIVVFHLSNYRTFKHFYPHVRKYWRREFPHLVCYARFVALQAYLLVPLCLSLNRRKGRVTGISLIDSTGVDPVSWTESGRDQERVSPVEFHWLMPPAGQCWKRLLCLS